MRIGAIVNAYNEIEWLDTTLKCIVNHFDEVVVTEGAYKVSLNVGAPPRSTDGTLEILEKYKQYKNVTVLHENELNQAHQLNKGLAVLKEKNIDWMMVVDADEVWQEKDLQLIKKYIALGDKNGIYQYKLHFYDFTSSFDRYAPALRKRVFKVTPGCEFVLGNENMSWPDHHKSVDVGQEASYLSTIPEMVRGFHYTEIKHKNRWLLKREYLIGKSQNDPNGLKAFTSWHIDENGFHHDAMHLVKEYKGTHPKIVQETELYKEWKQDPQLLKKALFEDK
jgi:glycosyltransferase involved in cell wall biosynthesis